MKIKINKKNYFNLKKAPLIIAEISGNHCGNKKLFLKHIREAAKNGADLIKIQTYEPEDITVNDVVFATFSSGNADLYVELGITFNDQILTEM